MLPKKVFIFFARKIHLVLWVPLFAGLGQGVGMMLPLDPSHVAIISGTLNISGGILAKLYQIHFIKY